MANIRKRGSGWTLTVRHKALPRPYYRTFDTEEEATTYGKQLEAILKRGIVPQSILESINAKKSPAEASPAVTAVVLNYLRSAPCSASETEVLTVMLTELEGYLISDITFDWAEKYVRYLKSPRDGVVGASRRKLGNLAPGSIRKRVSALSRVIDWYWRKNSNPNDSFPLNPLKHLPRGYSVYNHNDVVALEGTRYEPKNDVARNRRLSDAEIQAIEKWLLANEWIVQTEYGPKNISPDLLMFVHLAIHTGMRMREIVRLRVNQIDWARRFINVEGSKGHRGSIKPRTVAIKPYLEDLLHEWCRNRVGLVLGFWNGDPKQLRTLSSTLSSKFRTLFKAVGIENFTEHDLRHTACCIWVEMRLPDGGWVMSDVDVCRTMGWSDYKMYLRYASLRGEDLAARMDYQRKK